MNETEVNHGYNTLRRAILDLLENGVKYFFNKDGIITFIDKSNDTNTYPEIEDKIIELSVKNRNNHIDLNIDNIEEEGKFYKINLKITNFPKYFGIDSKTNKPKDYFLFEKNLVNEYISEGEKSNLYLSEDGNMHS